MVAGTVTEDLFLASRVARSEGWGGGLRGEDARDEGTGEVGEFREDAGDVSLGFFGSSDLEFSFLVVIVMVWMVVL